MSKFAKPKHIKTIATNQTKPKTKNKAKTKRNKQNKTKPKHIKTIATNQTKPKNK